METRLVYLENQYQKECDSTASWFEFTDLVTDQTVFYPTSDGQPNDRGKVIIDGREYVIVDTWSDGDNIHLMSHDTFPDDTKGKKVHQVLDWDVRYMHMRFRTALKVISGLAYSMFGATTRINQTYDDQAWFDFEKDEISNDDVVSLFQEVNKVLFADRETSFRYIPRDEFIKDADMMKICKGRVPDLQNIRIMDLEGVPSQMEFGTNVAKTGEVGKVDYKTTLIKGKIGRRINITLSME